MLTQLSAVFIIPLVLSLLITPGVIWLAKRIGAMDEPNERKVHKYPIPRLGGVGIYASFFISLFILFYLGPSLDLFSSMQSHTIVMLAISLTLVLAIGIWDDIRSVTPGRKFLGQCLAATIVYLAGFRISAITHPFNWDIFNLGLLEYPVTVLWIVGITNAVNLIDGLDGLAAGVAFIVSVTISVISYLKGDLITVMMALILAGAVLGFLRYNFNGAKIFLGDSGSLFLGFLLAILSMQSSTKGSAAFSLVVPVLTLGLPIMDTLLSMVRRFLRSVFPEGEQPRSFLRKLVTMFLPDRGHIHHQLIARGFSHRKVVIILYLVSCMFGVGAFAVTFSKNIAVTPVLLTLGVATFIGLKQLRYHEMAILGTGILLPIYKWPMINSSFFQSFLDLGFIILAYAGAHFFSASVPVNAQTGHEFLENLMIIGGIRLSVFYFCGLYKASFRQLDIGGVLIIFKTVILSVIITWAVVAFLPTQGTFVNATLVVLDFYFLLSLVLGARISFHILNYYSLHGQQPNGKKRVLIYGADSAGVLLIQQILHDESLKYRPVGFLDENPKLEGKRLSGYPIFGGHWKLQKIIRQYAVEEIIVSAKVVMHEELERVKKIAKQHGVTLRRPRISFEQFPIETGASKHDPYSIRLIEEDKVTAGLSRIPSNR